MSLDKFDTKISILWRVAAEIYVFLETLPFFEIA